MSDEKKVSAQNVLNLGFKDGYITALAQLEMYLIQTFANKILGIKDMEKFLELSEAEQQKVMDEKVKLGVFLASIDKLRAAVGVIMKKPTPQSAVQTDDAKPANEPGTLDGSVILG